MPSTLLQHHISLLFSRDKCYQSRCLALGWNLFVWQPFYHRNDMNLVCMQTWEREAGKGAEGVILSQPAMSAAL